MIGGLQDWDSLTRLKWSGRCFVGAVGVAPAHRLRRGHSGSSDLRRFVWRYHVPGSRPAAIPASTAKTSAVRLAPGRAGASGDETPVGAWAERKTREAPISVAKTRVAITRRLLAVPASLWKC